MKSLLINISLLLLVGMTMGSCKRDYNYFTAKVTPTVTRFILMEGDELEITKVEVSDAAIQHGDDGPVEPVTEYTVDHIDYFIGNVKIGESSNKPYAFKYTIGDLPAGEHELRVDALITDIPKRVWRDKDDSKYPNSSNPKGKHRARVSATCTLYVIK